MDICEEKQFRSSFVILKKRQTVTININTIVDKFSLTKKFQSVSLINSIFTIHLSKNQNQKNVNHTVTSFTIITSITITKFKTLWGSLMNNKYHVKTSKQYFTHYRAGKFSIVLTIIQHLCKKVENIDVSFKTRMNVKIWKEPLMNQRKMWGFPNQT